MKTLTLLLAISVISITSCELIENLIKIPIRLNSELTIPAGTGAGVLIDVFSDETETNIEDELTINDSRKDKIKTIYLKECVLTITNPSSEDFSFLNEIQVFLSDEELGDVLIASNLDISNDVGNEITLDTENVDVSEYIKKDSMTLLTKVKTDEVLLNNVTVNIFTRFQVTADIF